MTDAERDRLNARLNAAFTAGTLEQEDYQARLDRLFAAKRLGELVPVVEGCHRCRPTRIRRSSRVQAGSPASCRSRDRRAG